MVRKRGRDDTPGAEAIDRGRAWRGCGKGRTGCSKTGTGNGARVGWYTDEEGVVWWGRS